MICHVGKLPLVFSTIPTDVYGNPFATTLRRIHYNSGLAARFVESPQPIYYGNSRRIHAAWKSPLDSHEVISNADFLSIVMLCQTFVWDISYRSFNGTSIIEEANLSNLTMPQTMSGPAIDRGGLESLSAASLSSSLTIPMVASTTVDEFLSKFAAVYNQITLAYVAGSFDAIASTTARKSSTNIVACVPMAPLWTLVVLRATDRYAYTGCGSTAYCYLSI
jgi:hypothetical protein